MTKKTSENKRKKRNNNEAPPKGQQTLFDVFQVKKCDTANNSDEHVICNISESVVVSDIFTMFTKELFDACNEIIRFLVYCKSLPMLTTV